MSNSPEGRDPTDLQICYCTGLSFWWVEKKFVKGKVNIHTFGGQISERLPLYPQKLAPSHQVKVLCLDFKVWPNNSKYQIVRDLALLGLQNPQENYVIISIDNNTIKQRLRLKRLLQKRFRCCKFFRGSSLLIWWIPKKNSQQFRFKAVWKVYGAHHKNQTPYKVTGKDLYLFQKH